VILFLSLLVVPFLDLFLEFDAVVLFCEFNRSDVEVLAAVKTGRGRVDYLQVVRRQTGKVESKEE